MRLRATKRKYKEKGAVMRLGIPVRNGMYITGQEVSPDNPNGLSQEEIKNPDLIPAEKRKYFPFVISPGNASGYIRVYDNMDLSEDTPSTKAILGLIKLQPNIAMSRAEHNAQKHDFFIEDVARERRQKVSSRQKTKKAWDLIEDASDQKRRTFLVYAGTETNKVGVTSPNLSRDDVYNICVDLTDSHPHVVLDFFDPTNHSVQKKVSILELVTYQVITRKEKGYFDGSSYLGSNLKEVVDYVDNPMNASVRDRLFKVLSMRKSADAQSHEESSQVVAIEEKLKKAKILYADGNMQKAINILEDVDLGIASGELKKEFTDFRRKVLTDSTAQAGEDLQKINVDFTDMNEDEIRNYFRKNKIKGWNNSMSKEELIEFYKSV